jgi:hypothetical protein
MQPVGERPGGKNVKALLGTIGVARVAVLTTLFGVSCAIGSGEQQQRFDGLAGATGRSGAAGSSGAGSDGAAATAGPAVESGAGTAGGAAMGAAGAVGTAGAGADGAAGTAAAAGVAGDGAAGAAGSPGDGGAGGAGDGSAGSVGGAGDGSAGGSAGAAGAAGGGVSGTGGIGGTGGAPGSAGSAGSGTLQGCTHDQVQTHGAHDYYFCSNYASWTAARDLCAAGGGGLVRVDDDSENAFLTDHFGPHPSWWIGANDVTTEGQWYWSAGSTDAATALCTGNPCVAEAGLYVNFAGGEPSAFGDEDCAALQSVGTWSGEYCVVSKPFVCELE